MREYESHLVERWAGLIARGAGELLAAVVEDLTNCPEADRIALVRRFSAFACGPRADAVLLQQLFSFVEQHPALAGVKPAETPEQRVQQETLRELHGRLEALSGVSVAKLEARKACQQMQDRIDAARSKLKTRRDLLEQVASTSGGRYA